jgi:flagellar biosynthesis/type III secretory pathway protein FliH
VVGLKIDPNTAVLSGYCLGNDGKLHYSELPLGDHFANHNGVIFREKNGHFDRSAINIGLDYNWCLCADLLQYNPKGHYNSVSIEFAKYVRIEDGKFVMDDPPGIFDLRGPIMRFLEDVPVVGYAIAGIDELEGDEDEAKRALAECTYSTLITAGAIAGFAFTGPIGAAMGSAFGAMVGLEAKAGIGLSINDPQMRNQVTSISVWQVLSIVASLAMAVPIDMVISGLMDALAEGVFEDGLLARAWQQAISEGDGALGKYGLKTVGADEAKKILTKIAGLIQDDLAQGKSNEEIAADISKLYSDDDSDGTNPLNDVTLPVKKAVKAASNKALQDAQGEIENAVKGTAHDVAQSAVQEAWQEAMQAAVMEVGQEVAQELVQVVQEAEGSAELLKIENAAQAQVDVWVLVIKRVLQDPRRYADGPPINPQSAFGEVLRDIRKAPEGAAQFVKDSTAPLEKDLENAKDTARKPFQGTTEDAASQARAAAGLIANLVSEIKTVATTEGQVAIKDAADQVDKAMQMAVQGAAEAIKREAEETAQDSTQDVKEAVHKAVQKVKDAEKEVQATIHDAMLGVTGILSMAFDTLVQAAGGLKWTGSWDDIEPAVQGAVPGAVQDAKQSIQNIADTALQKALQELQAGPEVQKVVRKAAQDATEDEVSKIPKMVQDCVPDAVEAAKKEYNRVAGEDPHPKSHGMQPGGVKPV